MPGGRLYGAAFFVAVTKYRFFVERAPACPDNGDMTPPPEVTAGFPEMLQPVHDKYRLFFEAAMRMQPLVNEMLRQPVTGQLADIVARLISASCNTMGAMLTLVLNGYGHDAMKLARSIYEVEINILWLKKHPEEITAFLDFNIIQQKEIFDAMDEEQQHAVPVERREKMMDEYTHALERFGVGKGKTRARNEWCATSFYERAKAAEEGWAEEMKADGLDVKPVSLYKAFYRPASSIHHGDIGGLIAQVDSDLNVELPPSWSWLDEPLINGIGSFLRMLNYFNEIAKLSFKEHLQSGPNRDYAKA
jgi:hypothetical protein